MSYLRTTLAVTGILATTLALAGCSSSQPMGGMGGMAGDSSSSASAGDFNTKDVTFTQMMIPHHEQAVMMSDVILAKKGIDSRVIELATNIKSAQGPEIKTMKSWLKAWGASDGGMAGMDHGNSGMMSDSEMTGLDSATGTDAARLFLTGMTAHHEGAIVMAETEVTGGKNADAISLAKEIIAAQTSEITAMKEILVSL
ncbi:DUF305 domain-containing protein [Frigoribacterium sp. CG_9.8]|uniref:DUF305 domain-containing protein n=1 Tax=Frigoribacterium sp. CG_9.8 TaxID=2787733 RepID=UPI0018CAECDD|nr:DUF305 domain-containing protein [Frigoribacterium sp. CG_9.8]MBG6106649.1 uncharacterized protein (DUF305 family) [Frigoribacterium sp. CG_9.8]